MLPSLLKEGEAAQSIGNPSGAWTLVVGDGMEGWREEWE